MSNKNKLEKVLEKSQPADVIKNIFTTLLSATVVGGPFANLINSFIPSRRFLRLETFVNDLVKEIEKIKEEIDVGYINTEEFAFLFERSINSASENYQKEKLDAYKGILLNALQPNNYNQDQKEFYLNLVNRLTVLHLRILTFSRNTFDYLDERDIDTNTISGNMGNSIQHVFSDHDFDTVKMAVNDLFQYGLIDFDTSHFGTMTVNQGMDLIGTKRTTESGDKFVDFITK